MKKREVNAGRVQPNLKLPTRACLARREGKCERNGKGREVVAGLGVARASQ